MIAQRLSRTVAELLATVGAGELHRWYAHLALEADEAEAARGD